MDWLRGEDVLVLSVGMIAFVGSSIVNVMKIAE